MHPDDARAGGNNLKLGWQLLGHFGHIEPKLPTPNTMEHLPSRTGEAYERHLYRGDSKSKRTSSGNLREVIMHEIEKDDDETVSDTDRKGL
jgi:hypothetical protein